jgi:surface polysaccharide O-acyltransferase-like enzyme
VVLMISGALLLNKQYATKDFFKKRTSRIIYPFLFWTVLYFVYYWYIQKAANQPHGFHAIFKWMFNLAKDGVSYHFWFIYMLLGLYAFMPWLSKSIKKLRERYVYFILICWFILLLVHSICMYVFAFPNIFGNYITSLVGFCGYLILCFVLHTLVLTKRKGLLFGVLFFIVGAAITILGTYISAYFAGKYTGFYYNFLSVNVLFEAIGIFLIFKYIEIKSKALLLIRDLICINSFGIYFVHVMVLGFFFRAGFWWGMAHSVLTIPAITLSCLIVSLTLIWLLKRLPFGKYIAG